MLISDKTIEIAFDWLESNAGPSAAAKAERVRAEHHVKIIKARLFLKAEETSIAAKEAWATAHPDYEAACEREAKAVQEDENHRNQRNKAEALIEAWRSQSANIRAMGKVA